MKSVIIAFFSMAFMGVGFAQQRAAYNQYGSIITPVNPAGSFLRPEGEVSLVGRHQWAGLDGAPKAYWLSVNSPVLQSGISGGLLVRHESVAVEKTTEVLAYGGVSVPLTAKDRLALSIGAGASVYKGNFSELDGGDPTFKNNISKTEGLLALGLMYYRPEKFYAGLSIPRLSFAKLRYNETPPSQHDMSNQYHFTAGGLLPVAEWGDLKLSGLASYASNLGIQARLSPILIVEKTAGLGADFSSEGDLSGIASLHTGAITIGYSYQFYIGNKPMSRTIRNQTHELSFAFRLGKGTLHLL